MSSFTKLQKKMIRNKFSSEFKLHVRCGIILERVKSYLKVTDF